MRRGNQNLRLQVNTCLLVNHGSQRVKMDVLDIGVEARRVSIIKTNQKVRKSVQKQMEPYHSDDFGIDPFIRFFIVLLLIFE